MNKYYVLKIFNSQLFENQELNNKIINIIINKIIKMPE